MKVLKWGTVALGFLIAISAVGASDCGMLGDVEFMCRALIGLVLMAAPMAKDIIEEVRA